MQQDSQASADWRMDFRLADVRLDDIDLLSLDVFDTLLLRRCGRPDRVFIKVAEQARQAGQLPNWMTNDAFVELRREAERTARLKCGHSTTLDDIYSRFNIPGTDPDRLKEIEFAVECNVLTANPSVLSLLKEARTRSVRVILVSDMYLPKAIMAQILGCNNIIEGRDFDKLYVSCDYSASKAGGGLFRHVLKDHNGSIAPERILHIGDDPTTDLAGARSASLKAIHYQIPTLPQNQFRLEALLTDNQQGPLAAARSLAASSINPDDKQAFWKIYGATILGPIVVHYATEIVRHARSLNITRIAPLMREGDIIGRMVELEARRLGVKLTVTPLFVSRTALYLPSLSSFCEEDFRKLSAELHLTLNDVCNVFGLGALPSSLISYSNRPLVDILSLEAGPEAHIFQAVREFIFNEQNQSIIRDAASVARAYLVEYVTQTLGRPGSVLLVDLGARGTMFDRLQGIEEISDRYDFYGSLFYMMKEGMYRALQGRQIHSHTPLTESAFARVKLIYRSPQFIELLLNGDIETTVGYQRNADGNVYPVRQPNDISDQQRQALVACHAGIMHYRECWTMLAGEGDSAWDQEVSADYLLTILHRAVHLPIPVEAQHLGKLIFDVNNGSSVQTSLCPDNANDTIANLCSGTVHDLWLTLSLRTRPSEVPWPQGSLTVLYPDFIERTIAGASANFDHHSICRHLITLLQESGHREFIICAAGGIGGMGPTCLTIARSVGLECVAYADLLVTGDGAGGDLEIPLDEVAQQSCRQVLVVSTGYGNAILRALQKGVLQDGRALQCWWFDGTRFRTDHLLPG